MQIASELMTHARYELATESRLIALGIRMRTAVPSG